MTGITKNSGQYCTTDHTNHGPPKNKTPRK